MDPTEIFHNFLMASGLTYSDARKAGIVFVPADKAVGIHPKLNAPSAGFKYFTTEGKKIRGMMRGRWLTKPVGEFGQPIDAPKYLQTPNTPNHAYFPQGFKSVDWKAIEQDPTRYVVITEGEKKACCACKHGYPTIGLPGVWNWKATKRGVSFLPELEAFAWEQRPVFIAFDSDALTKPQVAYAITDLTKELTRRGAKVKVATIPASGPDADKVGLDDFIVAQGAEAFQKVLDEAPTDELNRKLWQLNERVCFTNTPAAVYDLQLSNWYSINEFRSVFGNTKASVVKLDKQGNPKLKTVSVAAQWLEWEYRKQCIEVTYDPSEESIIIDSPRGPQLNIYEGRGVEPVKGDLTLWTELLDFLLSGLDAGARKWFENWLYYPIRFPGTKLKNAVGLWSRVHGTGKTSLAEFIQEIYGESNTITISQWQLESAFNGWAYRKQFVLVDEVTKAESRRFHGYMKGIITQNKVTINRKYLQPFTMRDCIAYFLTSNESNAFFVEKEDRRMFVHEVPREVGKLPQRWWAKFHKWKDSGQGPSALLHYILNDHNFGSFDPAEPPPMTDAKADMIHESMGALDQWLAEVARTGDLYLGKVRVSKDIVSVSQLTAAYNAANPLGQKEAHIVGRHAKDFLQPVNGGKRLMVDGTKQEVYYCYRNPTKWAKATKPQLRKHIAE